jgi:hypothetical protein
MQSSGQIIGKVISEARYKAYWRKYTRITQKRFCYLYSRTLWIFLKRKMSLFLLPSSTRVYRNYLEPVVPSSS